MLMHDEQLTMLYAGIAIPVAMFILFLVLRKLLRRGSPEVQERFGLDGWITYTDESESAHVFVNKRYGIKAKPDFLVKLRRGGYAVVEFKNRSSGRLFASDIAQVKATVLAVRTQYPVKQAYVIAGTTRHVIDVEKGSAALYKEIRTEVEQAKRVERGETLFIFPKSTVVCKGCSQRANCKNPAFEQRSEED
ncbi:PD-(D/E)XK nuclease family protein [Pseudomonas aeruginosa]